MLEPKIKGLNFWGDDVSPEEELIFGSPEFFCTLLPTGDGVASLGFWDGEELLWLMEYYHASGNDLVFYTLDEDSAVDEASKDAWLQFVSQKTPECLPWILFRLKELNLI